MRDLAPSAQYKSPRPTCFGLAVPRCQSRLGEQSALRLLVPESFGGRDCGCLACRQERGEKREEVRACRDESHLHPRQHEFHRRSSSMSSTEEIRPSPSPQADAEYGEEGHFGEEAQLDHSGRESDSPEHTDGVSAFHGLSAR